MGEGRRSQSKFVWATGLEDTFVVHDAPGRRRLDELELVGHYEQWREDVDRAAEIGFGAMRCGIPWYRAEPEPGTFDWSWTDQLLPYMVDQGIDPIVDLVHYGTPLWMPEAFADPRYVASVSSYAAAFADRYAALVRHYTPVNEPGVTALLCGYAATWPPYSSGHSGYVRVLDSLCRGIVGEVAAIRRSRPDAVIVHVEGTGFWLDADAPAGSLGSVPAERVYAPLDLLTGSIGRDHELHAYLTSHGLTDDDFEWYRRNAMVPDVIGLNYYPDGSVHRRMPDVDAGSDSFTTEWGGTEHLAQAIREFHGRYQRPIFISETGCNERSSAWVRWPGPANGADRSAFRSWWLGDLSVMLQRSIADGLPVWGCTWWPLIDAVSWAYRDGTGALATYLEPGGLVRSVVGDDGRVAREPLAIGEHLREVVHGWT